MVRRQGSRNAAVNDADEGDGEMVVSPPTVGAAADAMVRRLREAEALHYAAGLDALEEIRCVQRYRKALMGASLSLGMKRNSHRSDLEWED